MARRKRTRRQSSTRGRQFDPDSGGFPAYVPVAERKRRAARAASAAERKGQKLDPVTIEGRAISKTFWGQAWCTHLERYGDYDNRLPRGRTYARNGSVIDLRIREKVVEAQVMGSRLYQIRVNIEPMKPKAWHDLAKRCAGTIGSMVDLLAGELSKDVMATVTDPKAGLFPSSREIAFTCSCPDWASMCKHVAATLYGVGARLDHRPELLFTLRGVDAGDLVSHATAATIAHASDSARNASARVLALDDAALAELFGVAIDDDTTDLDVGTTPRVKAGKARRAEGSAPRKVASGKAAATTRRPRRR